MAVKTKKKCLFDGCRRDAEKCGLCQKHYQNARRNLKKGVPPEILVAAEMYQLPYTQPRTDYDSQLAQHLARQRKPRKCHEKENKSA